MTTVLKVRLVSFTRVVVSHPVSSATAAASSAHTQRRCGLLSRAGVWKVGAMRLINSLQRWKSAALVLATALSCQAAEPNPTVSTPAFTNRLAKEKSPYLIQHQHNPVDWYPWGEEAFAKAKAEDKPIFLSIGYSTCHWCHVMEHESFEDAEVAALL